MELTRWPLVFALLATAGCTHVGERVALLPSADDGHVGALEVRTQQGKTELTRPYAEVQVKGGELTHDTLTKAEVKERYGSALDAQPPQPHVYTVYFYFDTADLKPDAMAVLDRIKADLKTTPAAEVLVVGHTDRAGPTAFNYALSMRRARALLGALVAIGVPRDSISIDGRGEKELAVPTADGVAEAKNRRVEIKLR